MEEKEEKEREEAAEKIISRVKEIRQGRNRFKVGVILLVLVIAGGGLVWFYLPPGWFNWKSLTGSQPEAESETPGLTGSQPEAESGALDLMSNPLKNKFGIRIKVLTKKRHIRCSSEPGGVPDGQELGYFRPYFVFDLKRFEDNPDVTYYEIGPTPRAVDKFGWVSSLDVQQWDTRVGDRYDRPIGPDGNYLAVAIPAIYVYGSKEEAIASLTDRQVPWLAEARLTYKSRPLMAWPIISAPEKVLVNNRTYELHQLAFLGSYEPGGNVIEQDSPASAAVSKTKEEKEKIKAEVSAGVKRIDVVFVVDSTLSMTPYIEQVLAAVRSISNGLQGIKSFKPDIAFGAVEYRDYVENLTLPNGSAFLVHSLTDDVDIFLTEKMYQVKAATIPSIDYPEAVFDGLRGAIEQMNWREVYAERIIILIGDDPSHGLNDSRNPHNLTEQDITALATKDDKHITIFSLMAPTSGEDQLNEHVRQFSALAKGTNGSCHSLSDADDVVPLIEQFVGSSIQKAEVRNQAVKGFITGGIDLRASKPVIRNPYLQVTEDQVTEVLKFLSRVGVDGKDLAPGEITFSTGWAITESAGQIVLKKQVYLAKAELASLLSELWSIYQVGGYTASKPLDLFHGLVPLLTEGIFLKSETNLPMDVWLAVKGIPIHPNSILSFSKEELLSSRELREAVWLKIEQDCLPSLQAAYFNQPVVYFPDPDPLSFGWINEEFLP